MIDKLNIRIWQLRTGIRQIDIAKKAGVSQPIVSLVLDGHRKSKKVVNEFIRRGCPKEYFGQDKAQGASKNG